MNIHVLKQNNPDYPEILNIRLGTKAPKQIAVIGNLAHLKSEPIGLFCSEKCPGNQILKTYDLMRKWRDEGKTIISGFHSPIEKDCLDILLKGQQPLILCLGSQITPRTLNKARRKALAEDRLLILSPFENEERITKETAWLRNLFVAGLSNSIFVAYADKGGMTEKMLAETANWGLLTIMLESTKEVKNIESDSKRPGHATVKRVLPLFEKHEKFGQVIGENGLGEIRPPRD